jgi:hypothetical protein
MLQKITLTAEHGEEWVGEIEIITDAMVECRFTKDGRPVDDADVPDYIYEGIMGRAINECPGLMSQAESDRIENPGVEL